MAGFARRILGLASGRRSTLVTFRRSGGLPPPDWEVLEIAESGAFSLWRSVNRPASGPARAGRFTGELGQSELDALRAALKASPAQGGPAGRVAPDSSIDRVRFAGRELTTPADAGPPGGWDAPVAQLRRLVDTLTGHPLAAVGLEATGEDARLVHLGTTPLELDLSSGAVRVVRWAGDELAGEWTAPLDGPRSVTAAPGWTFGMPFGHGFGAGAALTVSVDRFLAFDGEFWRACGLQVPVNRA